MNNTNRIKIAIQKSGKLSQDSKDFLQQVGISVPSVDRQMIYRSEDMPVDIIFVRDDDIPSLICNKVCDFGIVGSNVLEEYFLSKKKKRIQVLKELDFSKCRLSIAAKGELETSSMLDLNGKKIATSYPSLLEDILEKQNIKSEIVYMSGCVEIAPSLGVADYICDIVSTGNSLRENNLKELYNVFESQALLIANNNISDQRLSLFKEMAV
jgi:ATP phosphoribosyltransferase